MPTVFFVTIGASAIVAAGACRWLVEPEGSFAERHTDMAVAPADVVTVTGRVATVP